MAEENVNAFGLPDALAKRLAEITPDQLIPPEDARPEGVESSGDVPEELRPLWTLCQILDAEYEADRLLIADTRNIVEHYLVSVDLIDGYFQGLDALVNDPELTDYIETAALVEMDLPEKGLLVNLVAEKFEAEFYRRFPAFAGKNVTVYKDWSFSVLSDEDAAALNCWVCGDRRPLSL